MFTFVECFSQSPDLHQTENLWHDVKTVVHQQNISNLKEQPYYEKWTEIPVVGCGELIETNPERLTAGTAAKGAHVCLACISNS